MYGRFVGRRRVFEKGGLALLERLDEFLACAFQRMPYFRLGRGLIGSEVDAIASL